jgi:hypothetical protein
MGRMKESKYIRADLFMNKIAGSAFFSAAEKGKIRAAIEKEPEEDAMPVVHAHWKDDGFDYGYHDFSQCTACGWKNPYAIVPWFKFCPNCGAKMDEEIDDGYM